MAHKFGGMWTRKKLDILEKYLNFYSTALKDQPFTLHYVDAFAGTGTHSPANEDDQELLIPYEDFQGSVKTALDIKPGFDHYHFNDLNPDHVAELNRIKDDQPDKTISVYQQDANSFVPDFCSNLGKYDRAVLFLDPYSTQLDWSTLEHVAKSRKVDLWLLFPLSVILRMTPTDEERIREEWEVPLNRLLGTDAWKEVLYKPTEKLPVDDLFGDNDASPSSKRLNTEELEQWVTGRLRQLFPWVADPVRLRNNGRPLFSFYFAVSNSNRKAWRLAAKVAKYITKQVG